MKFFSKFSLGFIATMSASSAFAKQDCAAIAAVYNGQPTKYACHPDYYVYTGGQYVSQGFSCYEKGTTHTWALLNVQTQAGGCSTVSPAP